MTNGSPVIPWGQEHNAFPSATSQTALVPHGFGSQGSNFNYTGINNQFLYFIWEADDETISNKLNE